MGSATSRATSRRTCALAIVVCGLGIALLSCIGAAWALKGRHIRPDQLGWEGAFKQSLYRGRDSSGAWCFSVDPRGLSSLEGVAVVSVHRAVVTERLADTSLGPIRVPLVFSDSLDVVYLQGPIGKEPRRRVSMQDLDHDVRSSLETAVKHTEWHSGSDVFPCRPAVPFQDLCQVTYWRGVQFCVAHHPLLYPMLAAGIIFGVGLCSLGVVWLHSRVRSACDKGDEAPLP